MNGEPKTGRRPMLAVLAASGCAAAGAVALAPGVKIVAASSPSGGRGFFRTVKVESLSEGMPVKVTIVTDVHDAFIVKKDEEIGSVWLVKRGGQVLAFSTVCPHLGCAIGAKDDGFTCPCHDSDFGADGARKTGPSPRGMDALTVRIEGGYVHVDFRKFRQGTASQIEVG
jgi:menaquinol-cytochrome c reductase iron-sulfur subunit